MIFSKLYVDSKYSEIMQLTDVVSYLLNKQDYVRLAVKLNPFGAELAKIANELDPKLIYNSIIKMRKT